MKNQGKTPDPPRDSSPFLACFLGVAGDVEPDACEAQAPRGSTRSRGAGRTELSVPCERPLAFEVGHGSFGFGPPPDDRFQGFQEVGTLREHLSI